MMMGMIGPGGLAAPWTPLLLPGLIAWYKADAGVFNDAGVTPATDTQTVQQWNDQSGNGYHLKQATSGLRPQFLTAGLNSKQAVKFTGLSSTALVTAAGVAMGTGNAASAVAIAQMNTLTQNFGRIVAYGPPSASDAAAGGASLIIRTGVSNFFETSQAGTTGASQAASLATTSRFGVVYDGTNATTYLNNANPTTVANNHVFISAGYISVGANIASGGVPGGNTWDGPISEIVITNQAMSSGDRAFLDTYLTGRW